MGEKDGTSIPRSRSLTSTAMHSNLIFPGFWPHVGRLPIQRDHSVPKTRESTSTASKSIATTTSMATNVDGLPGITPLTVVTKQF